MGAGEGFQTWVREGPGTPVGRDAVRTAEAPPGSGTQWGPPGLGLGQGAGGDSYGCVDLLTLRRLRH